MVRSSAMRELRDKYVAMRAMRVEHEAGAGGDPRERMRALAARFPGALREIDELPLATIEARIAELDEVLRTEREAPRWAIGLAEYHAWMRAALAIRREAGVERDRDRALAWIEAQPAAGTPSREELREALGAMLRPPDGRLNRWLFERLARREGVSREAIEARLFTPGPHRARR